MVSPFMSFATGALQAVDKNIDRYRAEKAAEAERADAAAQRMKELEFQRQTKLDVQDLAGKQRESLEKLKLKNEENKKFIMLGGLKIPKIKGAAGVNAKVNYLAANPDLYVAAKKDSTVAPLLQAELANIVIGARTMSEFYEKISPVSKRGPRHAILTAMFAQPLRNNPELLKDMRALEDAGVGLPPSPNGVASRKLIGGQMNYTPEGDWINPAVDAMSKARLSSLGRNMSEKVNAVTDILGNYNSNLEKYEGNNKFWSAASSPFIKFIGRKGPSTKQETEEAMKWINDPTHGFVDVSPSGVITKNEDYFFLVNAYANQAAGKRDIYGDTQLTYTEISAKKEDIKKRVTEIQQSKGLAVQAKKNLTRLRGLTKTTESGSRITTGLLAGIPGFKRVVTDAVGILTKEVVGVAGKASLNPRVKQSAKDNVINPALKVLNEARAKKDDKAIAAAEIRVLEISLAYQLTSILQGGTGGRTISDQDVKMALQLFTGDFVTVDQKLAKIDAIMSLVDDTFERAKLYDNLTPDSNANYYYTLTKLDNAGLLGGATLADLRSGALNTRINEQLKIKAAEEQEGGPITNVINSLSKLDSPNYKADAYRNEITNLVGNSEPELRAGRYVLNKDDSQKWKNAVETGNPEVIQRVSKELEESGRNRIFDGQSGTIVPIRWSVNSQGKPSFTTIEQTPAADSTLATVGRKPSGESRTGATTEDAILKLFEVRQQPKRNRPPGR